MLTPKVIIDGFEAGILADSTIQATNGFAGGAGIDIFFEPGILKVSPALTAMTEAASPNNITDKINWILKYGTEYFALGAIGRIYKYVSSAWTLQHTDATSGSAGEGFVVFNGNIHWMGDTNMGKFDGTTWTDGFKTGFTSAEWHPMIIFGDKLYVGNERYVASLDTSDALTLQALDLPQGWIIKCLAVYGNRLMIGASNAGSYLECGLFSWDGTSSSFEEIWTLKENSIDAMVNWQNLLIVFAGQKGKIYAFNGASLNQLPIVIPNLLEFNTYVICPGAVTECAGNLIFGFGVADFTYTGIYQLANKPNTPLTLPYIPSSGLSTHEIRSLLFTGNNQFLAGWYDGTNSGIDMVSTTARIATTAYWESQIYEIAIGDNPIPIKGVELIARPMPTNTSVTVKYKKDNPTSWSTLGTINSTNQDKVLLGITGLCKTIQIRLEFTCSANNSPKIQTIRIY